MMWVGNKDETSSVKINLYDKASVSLPAPVDYKLDICKSICG